MLLVVRLEIKYIRSHYPTSAHLVQSPDMKVFLTGATGFLGAHIALELLEAGHDLRLLVRDPQSATRYFSAHGYEINDVVKGDMLDTNLVRQSLVGCEAVVHCAALVSLDQERAEEVYHTNVGGLESVLGSAITLGIRNLLYVSSFTVLFRPCATTIDETAPLGHLQDAYGRSKIACERWVRERQSQGIPIQISYPSGIYGPDDPGLSESNKALVSFVRGGLLTTSSGTTCVDVRDLAKMHRWMLENAASNDATPERFVMGGHFFTWNAFGDSLQAHLAKPLKRIALPGWLLRAIGRLLDGVRRFRKVEAPITAEAMRIMTLCPHPDSGRITKHSGLTFRPADETLSDTLRWLVDAGHLARSNIMTDG